MQCPTECVQHEFEFDFPKNSSTGLDELKSFVVAWASQLALLGLNTTETTKVFQLVAELVDKLTLTNVQLFHDSNRMSPEYIANASGDLVKSELSLYTTAHKLNKKNSSGSLYVHPQERAIGTRIELKRDRNINMAIPRVIQSTCQYIPISESLEALFRNKNFNQKYFRFNSEKHECIEGEYRNFCCGDVHKNSPIFNEDPYSLQIQIFTDDFELCNPLQSKAGVHKICGVYFLVRNFPQQFLSRVNFIQLVCLCYSDDVNKSTQADFNNIWQLILEDMRKLESEGIQIGSRSIKAAICFPSFDNLGANLCLGFAGSFSAHYFCRFCECDRHECSTLTHEIESKIRTEETYASCLKVVESLEKIDYRRTYGIKRDCLLNELEYFHVTRNISADILHDIYEGAMPFLMQHVIEYMIASKIVKKNEIIQMVQFFDFGELNRSNVPSILSFNKSHLGQNGAQSRCLFQHFPFIIARFKANDKLIKIWDSMELLSRVSQIVHSFVLTADDLHELADTVSRLLTSIQVNFRVKLIPKLHNLVHYPRIIKTMGPVAHMNVQRFESKHKVFKKIISRSPCFANVCKMLAVRHQQHMSISDFGLNDEISSGIKRLITAENCDGADELLVSFLTNRVVHETKYMCFNNYKYKKNIIIIDSATILKIEKILLLDEEFYFYCTVYNMGEFDSFLYAYHIYSKEPRENKIVKFDELSRKNTHERRIVEGCEYIIACTLDITKCSG